MKLRKHRAKLEAELEHVSERVKFQSGYSPRWVPTLDGLDIYTDPNLPAGSFYFIAASRNKRGAEG